MAKKPKNESIQDILDRIQEDIDIIRDKAEELENHDFDSDSDDDFDDDFEDDDSDKE
jgi:HEPN domain-containing protein